MGKIVVPGEVIAESAVRMPYTYTDGKKTYATVLSLVSEGNKLIPLEGPYEPLVDDVVIGYVIDVRFAGADVQINAPGRTFLSNRNTREKFALGSIIMARIEKVDETGSIDLSEARVLKGGILEKISPVKVPRLIGKKNSMIGMISSATECKIFVGRNGFVFILTDGNYELAKEAVEMIEREAHISGLTDRVAKFLSNKTGKEVVPQPQENVNPYADLPPREERREYGRGPPRQGGYGGDRRERRDYGDRRGPPRRHSGGYGDRRGPPRRPRTNSRY
ncbi:MAG: KH domain-containing protein [Candidatus Micrarchaeota archaeon]